MSFFVKLLGERTVRMKVDPGEVLTIGRSPETDLCIDERRVSRLHCELEGSESGLIVRDLKSRNGTRLNGERFRGEVIAHPGDQIKVGSAYILVERQAIKQQVNPVTTSHLRAAALEANLDLPFLPGFEVLAELGSGTTGKVYRARPASGGRHVAVKILKHGASETRVERFMRGAEALRRLDHPNIVKVYDVTSAGKEGHFFTMELLEGTTLGEMIAESPLGTRETLSIGVQVARALKLVHKEGIIHRDITPDNIMILHGGVVKLLGFDFVKNIKDTSSGRVALTKLGEIVGDITYSSPEQAQDPRTVDHRTDLYAVGTVLFKAVTGRPPFEGNRVELFRKVLWEKPPALRALVATTGEQLEAIVAKLLEKEPADRYENGADLEMALDDALLESCRHDPSLEAPAAFNESGVSPGNLEATMPVTVEDTIEESVLTPTPGPVRFGGGFSGFELLEILQFLELHEKEGRLTVNTGSHAGEISIRKGVIVFAMAGDITGEEAARLLLEAPEGTFEFHGSNAEETLPPPLGDEIAVQPSSIALDVMRKRDESARAAPK